MGWQENAKCRGRPELWDADRIPKTDRPRKAWGLCTGCPVLLDCARDAVTEQAVAVIRAGIMLPQAEWAAKRNLLAVIENGGPTQPRQQGRPGTRTEKAIEDWAGCRCHECGRTLRPSWAAVNDFPGTVCAVSMRQCRSCYNHAKAS